MGYQGDCWVSPLSHKEGRRLPGSAFDDAYHYPPELLTLLIDAIPLLCKSKREVLAFFRGAGVVQRLIDPWETKLRQTPTEVSKYHIARDLLTRINEAGDSGLRLRREVVKRVVQWEDFSTCWPTDRARAQGLVAQIRHIVNVRDSFTRMSEEREREAAARRGQAARAAEEKQAKAKEREQVKDALFALTAETDPVRRGRAFEAVLNRLFAAYGVLVESAFVLRMAKGGGVVEQIDGVISLDGDLYFVEAKWWEAPVGVPEVSQHLMRVFLRAEARALIISAASFTAPAVQTCKEALQQKVVVLLDLEELVRVLTRGLELAEVLRRKATAAIVQKEPLVRIV